jgi:hypothetical protein
MKTIVVPRALPTKHQVCREKPWEFIIDAL